MNQEEGYLALSYNQLIPPIVEAIKEQQKQIEELKTKLTQLTVSQDPNTGQIVQVVNIQLELAKYKIIVSEDGTLEVKSLKASSKLEEKMVVFIGFGLMRKGSSKRKKLNVKIVRQI